MNIVTRVTHGVPQVPTTLERLASYFERAAPIRAAASLGNDEAMAAAPNILPLQPPPRLKAVVRAICIHCERGNYCDGIVRDAARFAASKLRCGFSGASAVRSATVHADHLADVYGPQGVA